MQQLFLLCFRGTIDLTFYEWILFCVPIFVNESLQTSHIDQTKSSTGCGFLIGLQFSVSCQALPCKVNNKNKESLNYEAMETEIHFEYPLLNISVANVYKILAHANHKN